MMNNANPVRPRILGSVRSVAEARILLANKVDIIDLKEPRLGALGALPRATARAILSAVAGRARSSATIGDIAAHSPALQERIERTAALGVDYVKVGLFAGGAPGREFLAALRGLSARGIPIVAVVFADRHRWIRDWRPLADSGVCGVLLDTSNKAAGALFDAVDPAFLRRFLAVFRSRGLLVGFAGSLGLEHLDRTVLFEADYLGFRGALCRGAARGAVLDAARVAALCARVRAGGRRPGGFYRILRNTDNEQVA